MLEKLNLKRIIVSITASVAVSVLMIGLRHQGSFEQIELLAYDILVRLNAKSGSDPRITIVEIDHTALQKLNRDKISDATLKQVLEKISQYKPKVIGVNIVRNIPIGEGREELLKYINDIYQPLETAIKPIIFPCALPSQNKPQGIAPPPVIDPYSAIGFIDLETDAPDIFGRQIIRRAPISSIPVNISLETALEGQFDARSANYLCTVPFSFSFLTALSYIQGQQIQDLPSNSTPDAREFIELTKISEGEIKLKSSTFTPLKPKAGSYSNLDPSLYQYLIDYRYSEPGERVPLTKVLENQVTLEQFKDKVVLIGYTTKAHIQQTPLGSDSGVAIHGWMISQLLRNVLDGQRQIWSWSEPGEWLWIITWGIVGSIVGSSRNLTAQHIALSEISIFAGGMVIAIATLGGSCWLLFTQQGWVPLIPSCLTLVISGVIAKVLASSGTALDPYITVSEPTKTFLNPTQEWSQDDSHNSEENLADVEDIFIDKTIGEWNRYVLKKLLGKGGMSRVYLALDRNLNNKQVAIKIMTNYCYGNDQDSRKRFIGEIEKLCMLNHPNIIQIKEQGITPATPPFYGNPFYVMEYFEGKTLRQVIKKLDKIAYNLALKIIFQVCLGLKEAHKKGIIHRDIKPGNIFLSTGDSLGEVVKIIDFGIAKKIDLEYQQNDQRTRGFIGTYRYASPEQIRGINIDSRTDIYSLGVVFYEILSGEHPFESKDDDNYDDENAKPLKEQPACKHIPRDLETIIMKCLAQCPEDRFQTIQELERALRNFL
ncbi:MAG: CHASE2 domain-containing serine/threonine-protein kinase [Xenococcaceae cyanobacterium MO_167.B52]|nr:CHASE2 domain-containing serine/threonine-protein kinase [Xenococcaceae cyanobacterium MO_167.B52]